MSKPKQTHKILIIDDDKDILDLLVYNLQKEGYKVKGELNSNKSIDTAIKFHPDLIILDIMMPNINGIEICKQLREIQGFSQTYIFFLTAKSDKTLQKEAFDMGGDDFIEKITGLRALTYKIAAVLRKNLIIRKSIQELKVGNVGIDRARRLVYYKGREITLSFYEFELLFFFIQNPRKIITDENLMHNIWGSEIYAFTKSVETHVNNIKQKISVDLITKVNEGKYRLKGV